MQCCVLTTHRKVGPDDPDHGGLWPQPRDSVGQDNRRLLRPLRGVHPHPAHTHRRQQLRHLLQEQVRIAHKSEWEHWTILCEECGEMRWTWGKGRGRGSKPRSCGKCRRCFCWRRCPPLVSVTIVTTVCWQCPVQARWWRSSPTCAGARWAPTRPDSGYTPTPASSPGSSNGLGHQSQYCSLIKHSGLI